MCIRDSLGGLGLDDTSGQSGFGLGLADTGTGLGLTDTSEGTGVSMFDTAAPAGGTAGGTGAGLEDWVDDDPEATQIGDAIGDDISLEAVGSGSGLLDLTADSDDTALGAELLDAMLQIQVFELQAQAHPWIWMLGPVAGALIITVVGLAGSRSLIDTPPMNVLRGL